MKTIKFDHPETKIVAHRGISGLERENTCAAFVAAGVSTYWGIETDIHLTSDEKYLCSHDDNLKRCSGVDISIPKTDFDTLRAIPLLDTDGKSNRVDLYPPSLDEYISICKKYGKEAYLEIKGLFPEKHISGVIETITNLGWYERTTIISFTKENLITARRLCPDLSIELLDGKADADTLDFIKKYRVGADIFHGAITKEFVDGVHSANQLVNAYTVNTTEDAQRLISIGVDEITSNILE